MAIRRGTQAVHDAKSSSGGGGFSNRLIINAGESMTCRFYGDFEDPNSGDPLMADVHYIKRLQTKQYRNCGTNEEGRTQCVYCYMKDEGGDKGIGMSSRAFYHVKDMRKVHKLDKEVRVLKDGITFVPGRTYPDSDYNKTKYPPCKAGKGKCQYCAIGEARENGHRFWELAPQFADSVTALAAEARNFCLCAARDDEGGGTIQVVQYLCGNAECQAPVDFWPEQGKPVATCQSCRQSWAPTEEIACTACDNPMRARLNDFFVRATRTGGGTDTSYNFALIQPVKPPTEEELKEAAEKKPNMEDVIKPEPTGLQAQALGIPNPFEADDHQHGAQEYGDGRGGYGRGSAPPIVGQIRDMAQTGRVSAARPNASNPPRAGAPAPRPAARPPVAAAFGKKPAPTFKLPPKPAFASKPAFGKRPAPPREDDEIRY